MPEETRLRIDGTGKLGGRWCVLMHNSPMWPIHGEYQCRTCGRRYPVPWAQANSTLTHRPVPSLRIAGLALVIALALLSARVVRAAGAPIMESDNAAGVAFAHYIACLDEVRPWSLETIEIDASLPKLQKEGRLRAVRRLLPIGKPQYQVVETAGDAVVRQQVIVRYLSAEVRAAEIPASAVAITPANYKFRYKGAVSTGDGVAYVFQITPRKNRDGLIKGELWLDGDTGVAIRQSGRLVKTPSIFLKRVDITREIALHDGAARTRITHLTVTARFLGVAELTIMERPFEASNDPPIPGPGER
ncbi:MAG: hypothetical protein LAQ69_13655 [Acidobacteriia bacterium]|nr:hypothetical protein [Terriglobia bacterium]